MFIFIDLSCEWQQSSIIITSHALKFGLPRTGILEITFAITYFQIETHWSMDQCRSNNMVSDSICTSLYSKKKRAETFLNILVWGSPWGSFLY